MTAPQYFGAWLRLFGVVFLGVFVAYLFSILTVLANPRPDDDPFAGFIGATAVCFLFGVYFLRGAPLLMRIAYPENKNS